MNFKFGVLYCKGDQILDDEIFSNERGSDSFNTFLNLMGTRVRLKGWEKYRGGLDVVKDQTGQFSYHTIFEEHEIMFHVSTLLPFTADDRQQVSKKHFEVLQKYYWLRKVLYIFPNFCLSIKVFTKQLFVLKYFCTIRKYSLFSQISLAVSGF